MISCLLDQWTRSPFEWLSRSCPGKTFNGTDSRCTKCGWFTRAWGSFWCFILFFGQCAGTCSLWQLRHFPPVMKHVLWPLILTPIPCSLPLFFKTTNLLGTDYSPFNRQRAIGSSGSGSFVWKPPSAISISRPQVRNGAMPLMSLHRLRHIQSLQLSLKMEEIITLLDIPQAYLMCLPQQHPHRLDLK